MPTADRGADVAVGRDVATGWNRSAARGVGVVAERAPIEVVENAETATVLVTRRTTRRAGRPTRLASDSAMTSEMTGTARTAVAAARSTARRGRTRGAWRSSGNDGPRSRGIVTARRPPSVEPSRTCRVPNLGEPVYARSWIRGRTGIRCAPRGCRFARKRRSPTFTRRMRNPGRGRADGGPRTTVGPPRARGSAYDRRCTHDPYPPGACGTTPLGRESTKRQ